MQNQIINVVRYSLTAAQQALDLLEMYERPVVAQVSSESHPVQTVVIESNLAEQLKELLSDTRWRLRTVNELREILGLGQQGFNELLSEVDYEIVRKTRRSDGAALIGLASRN